MGQVITVSQGISLKNMDAYGLIGKVDDQFVLLKDIHGKYELQLFGQKKLRPQKTIKLNLIKRKFVIEKAFAFSNNLHIFFTSSKSSKTKLFYSKVNSKGEILDTLTVASFSRTTLNPVELKFERSFDKSKILIYNIGNSKKIEGYSFDLNQFKVLWNKSVVLNEYRYDRNFIQFLINNAGQGFLFIRPNLNDQKKETLFEVAIFDDKAKTHSKRIEFNEGFLSNFIFSYDELNKQISGAALSSADRNKPISGIYLFNYKNGETSMNVIPFQERFLSALSGNKNEKRILEQLRLKELILRRDGGVLLVAEMIREYSFGDHRVIGVRNENGAQIDYNFDDIILLNTTSNFQQDWWRILPKRQFSRNDYGIYSSFFTLKGISNLRFVYNDEITNNGNVNEYLINSDGTLSRNILLNSETEKLSLRVREGIQTENREVFFSSEHNAVLKLIRMSY